MRWLLGLTLSLFCCSLYFGVREVQRARASIASLESRVDSLSGELALTRAQLSSVAAPVAVQRPVVPAPPNAKPPVTTVSNDRARPSLSRAFAADYDEEAVDSVWANQAQHDLRDWLTREASVIASHVECRSTLCRAELSFADREAQQRFLESAGENAPPGFTQNQLASTDATSVLMWLKR